MHTSTYIVIAGSTRPNRRSPVIAQWIASLGEDVANVPFQVVDLRDLGLKLDDEGGIPAIHGYTQETTQAWGKLVADATGIVIVTPQYNWGYPAVLKNAIDHLFAEWKNKPVLIVTYGGHGGHGGHQCGEQLRIVLGALGTRLTEAMPGLTLDREMVAANDGQVDPAKDFASQTDHVRAALAELVALSDLNPSTIR